MQKVMKMNVGLVGCGVISEVYLESALLFNMFKIVKCADLNHVYARDKATKYGIQASDLDDMMNDSGIDIILNLTPPLKHKEINIQALRHGKRNPK